MYAKNCAYAAIAMFLQCTLVSGVEQRKNVMAHSLMQQTGRVILGSSLSHSSAANRASSRVATAAAASKARREARRLWRSRNTAARNIAEHQSTFLESAASEALRAAAQTEGEAEADSSAHNPELVEEWKDSGAAAATSLTDDQLREITKGVSAKAYAEMLHSLVDNIDSRFVGASGNAKMAVSIEERFKSIGLKTSVQKLKADEIASYVKSESKLGGNVIGILKGTDLANEVVLLGAHFDSVNWEDIGGKAPGVDDNGSGSALVMLAAKIFSEYAKTNPPRRTIMFVAFNGEEEGLVGSEQFAERAATGEFGKVKAAIVVDEVAWPGSGAGERKAMFETKGDVSGALTLIDTFAHGALFDSGDGLGGFNVNLNAFGSDHMSFLNRGIPALLLIERDDMYHSDNWGHSDRDTFDHVDFDYGAAMSRLAMRSLAKLAWPPAAAVA